MNRKPEAELQKKVAAYLRLQYPNVLFTSTLGSTRLTIGQAVNMKRCGYLNGIPDLLVFARSKDFVGMAIELKSDKGKVSTDQLNVMHGLTHVGWYCFVARSFDQCKLMIDGYLRD